MTFVDDLGGQVNPTRVLPRLKAQPSAAELERAIVHLALLYSPESLDRIQARLVAAAVAVPTSSPEYEDAMDAARVDESERRYAESWLTRFIATGCDWVSASESDELLDLAGRVLGGHAALEEAGALERRFSFPLAADEQEQQQQQQQQQQRVCVVLRDDPLPPSAADDDGSAAAAVGVQTWAAAVRMSDMLASHPESFHPALGASHIKVAELGAGTGLVGLTLAAMPLLIRPDIHLTDYHPDVLANLKHNADANNAPVHVSHIDWRSPPLQDRQSYHLLLAADVIYDPHHAQWLHHAISHLLTRDSDARAHILIALRNSGKFNGISQSVQHAFQTPQAAPADQQQQQHHHHHIEIRKITRLERLPGWGRPDEDGYLWFEIGWNLSARPAHD